MPLLLRHATANRQPDELLQQYHHYKKTEMMHGGKICNKTNLHPHTWGKQLYEHDNLFALLHNSILNLLHVCLLSAL